MAVMMLTRPLLRQRDPLCVMLHLYAAPVRVAEEPAEQRNTHVVLVLYVQQAVADEVEGAMAWPRADCWEQELGAVGNTASGRTRLLAAHRGCRGALLVVPTRRVLPQLEHPNVNSITLLLC